MTEEIRIGYLSTLYHTSLILKGSDLGGELGVEVSWRLFPTGTDMFDASEGKSWIWSTSGSPQPSSGSGGA